MDYQRYYKTASLLAVVTIWYNIAEGAVSVWLGIEDETLSLFGFGLDSFVEVISAVGVWHMIKRIASNGDENRDAFEQRALRITGGAFYLLTAVLALTALLSLYQQHKPETTFWGVVISLVSISFMWYLIRQKTKVGKAVGSSAILADAACSRACLHMSLVLLGSSAFYELTGLGGVDAVGALLLAWLTFKEGREAFEKAKGIQCRCCCVH